MNYVNSLSTRRHTEKWSLLFASLQVLPECRRHSKHAPLSTTVLHTPYRSPSFPIAGYGVQVLRRIVFQPTSASRQYIVQPLLHSDSDRCPPRGGSSFLCTCGLI